MIWLFLKALFGLIFVAIAAVGVGSSFSRILPDNFRSLERATFILLGGLGLLSTALFLLGQLSFTRFSIAAVLALAATVGALVVFKAFRRGSFSVVATGWPAIPAILIVLVLVFTAVCGLAEITGDLNNDAVAYHLLGPKVWLRDGIIRPVLDNCTTAFPQIDETLFAALWSVGGSRAPNFASFLSLGLLLAVAASLALRLELTNREAWWTAALLAAMPAVYAGAHACFVDVSYAAFVLAAARIGLDARRLREWAAFGLFSGLAIGTKYTGLLAIPAVIFCIALLNSAKNSSRPDLPLVRRIAVALAAAALIASPYYIRNWIQLGCPIYPPSPGYSAFCSPKYMSAEAISAFHAYIHQRGAGLGRSFGAFLLLSFQLTFHTSNFHGAGGIGLCPLALAPLGILSSRKNVAARVLVLLMFLLVVLWFFTQQESRFLIHVYVLAAIFAVLGWRTVVTNGARLPKYLLAAVVFLSCSYGLFMILKMDQQDARAVFSSRFAAIRRQASIPYLASFEYLNRDPHVHRVLILDSSVPSFYSDKDYVKPEGNWGERTLPGAPDSSQALAQALAHQLKVSHVLDVHSQFSNFQVSPGTPGLTLVFEFQNQRIYRIN
jgi:Dolichyl-phosphate-mannose-protein mannosyltransferase